jgi:hypothetical protein
LYKSSICFAKGQCTEHFVGLEIEQLLCDRGLVIATVVVPLPVSLQEQELVVSSSCHCMVTVATFVAMPSNQNIDVTGEAAFGCADNVQVPPWNTENAPGI